MITLEVRAIKVLNKGKSVVDAKVGKRRIKRIKAEGSDYLTFKCPGCGARNNRCIKGASYSKKKENLLGEEEVAYAFVCYKCHNTVEVSPSLTR
jgi:phage FluMu protein Com